MSNEIRVLSTPAAQALSQFPMFGPPPLLKGEDAAAYDELLARVSGNLKPSDIFEEIWVREIADLIWETFRWRRHLASFLATAITKILERILKPIVQNHPEPVPSGTSWSSKLQAAKMSLDGGQNLATDWAAGNSAAIERVNKLLALAGLTMDKVIAQTTASELDKIERFNRLIASAEGRRNALLREIEHHRAPFAQRLRAEIHKIENAEFETVKTNAVAPTVVCNKIAA
jgi:hypothetical protein